MSTKRKQGRPKKSKADKRSHLLAAAMTPAERAEVVRGANEAGQSLSDFIRARLLTTRETPKPKETNK